ncbi:hypothetical protein BT93_L1383 [Corymbia citriodora subsp. variegata]|uniref:Uncharacterized protein n=1 Tax=Corymbia citriodora subsp. variegata TaxID=360336 RepID=A0A8T0CN21_CORYI|nr:hypothetical protein BT93_L1383 [Corymbia citriodora subsp. variegata]
MKASLCFVPLCFFKRRNDFAEKTMIEGHMRVGEAGKSLGLSVTCRAGMISLGTRRFRVFPLK